MRRTPFPTLLVQLSGLLSVVLAATLLPALQAQAQSTGVPTAGEQERVAASTGTMLPAPGSYFSYPNRSRGERMAIRNRVLATIRSTGAVPATRAWHGAATGPSASRPGRSTTGMSPRRWWPPTEGASASRWWRPDPPTGITNHGGGCAARLGTDLATSYPVDRAGQLRPGVPRVVPRTRRHPAREVLPVRQRRAHPGTPHRHPDVDEPDHDGLPEPVEPGPGDALLAVHGDFLSVFQQSRLGRGLSVPYHTAALGNVVHYFFPRPGAGPAEDPVMQVLSGVRCVGATGGGTPAGRTKIRIIQYAVYGERGVWIAKRLRALWRAGLRRPDDLLGGHPSGPRRIRNTQGPGPIPMRQSVSRTAGARSPSYNHSKWMTITDAWGPSTGDHLPSAGRQLVHAEFGGDDQMQLIRGR